MNKKDMKRRNFLQTATTGTLTAGLAGPTIISAAASERKNKLAALGGEKICHAKTPSWPKVMEGDEEAWLDVLHKKGWCRLNGNMVETFEKQYAELTGTKDCIATSCGTTALYTSLNALDIGPGDEVLVPPYTFVATINVVLLQHALPIYVDTDRNTFQMDPRKIEEHITDRTKAIIPVHIGGHVCDMDAINAIAKKHNLKVIEDACQAHLAEWKGKKVGSVGDCGCFSFQVTKNLSSGEGGAIISDNIPFMDRCYSFHSNGRERTNKYGFGYVRNGINARMTEFQGTLLLRGLTRLEQQSQTREQNAAHLTKQLNEIPGIHPARFYDGVTRCAYHLYMFRYDPDEFAGAPRDKFIKAMHAEGAPGWTGYSPLNKQSFMENTLRSRAFENVFSKERIDRYFKENNCPENDKLCSEAVWFGQRTLLATKEDMDQIAAAIRKIQKNADQLTKI